MDRLPGPALRKLKSLAQKLEPLVFVGKRGLSDEFYSALNDALNRNELVKVKFAAFKEQKKELSLTLAESSRSHIVSRVGNVVVLYRRNEDPELRRINLTE